MGVAQMSLWWPKIELKNNSTTVHKIKTYIRRPQIEKFYKTDPTKSGNSDSKCNFQIFTNQKFNSKKNLLSSKKSKTYIRRPQIKKFYKTHPRKVGFMIQNTISKFSKTKNQTKKDLLYYKKSKTYIRRPQIKKFNQTDPTKSGNSDSNYDFEIFKN